MLLVLVGYDLRTVINSKRGMALLLVMTTIAIIAVIMLELGTTTRVTNAMASNYRDEVAAEYLAKSSLNVALLRITIANKVKTFKLGDFTIPSAVTSMIITLPFVFPPPPELLAFGATSEEGLDLGMKSLIDKIKKDTNVSKVGYFDQSISSTDNFININSVHLTEASVEIFREQMKSSYIAKIQEDESFGYRHPIQEFERVINNIIDWVDPDFTSRNGGDESVYYDKRVPPYRPRNSAMPTLSELHMIDGIDDELFDFITGMVTVFAGSAINVNKADRIMWKSIDGKLADEDIKLLIEKIQQVGDFTSEQELKTWIGQNTKIPSADFNPLKIPLSFEEESFKIEATGHSGKVSKKIICYVSEAYSKLLLEGKLPEKPEKGKETTTTDIVPKIVYWEYR